MPHWKQNFALGYFFLHIRIFSDIISNNCPYPPWIKRIGSIPILLLYAVWKYSDAQKEIPESKILPSVRHKQVGTPADMLVLPLTFQKVWKLKTWNLPNFYYRSRGLNTGRNDGHWWSQTPFLGREIWHNRCFIYSDLKIIFTSWKDNLLFLSEYSATHWDWVRSFFVTCRLHF